MSVRVDKWLWSVRAYKTRSQANDACASGRVRVNGDIAKPATKLVVGDRVEAKTRERALVYEVVQLLEKRVSAVKAAEAIIDHSPPPAERSSAPVDDATIGYVAAKRDRGAGRPTKRERREIERFRGTK